MKFSIAIDGPAGAGKSTVAKCVAKELSYIYVDTGAMYRAMALSVLRSGIAVKNEADVVTKCQDLEIALSYENGVPHVLLNQEDVTDQIRTQEVGNIASSISVFGAVRAKLTQLQRQIAQQENVVMDGRDIGTFVLVEAPLKIFLTADVTTRGKRRFDELTEKGISCNIDDIYKDIKERDQRDMQRPIAPLRQAEDAILIDSSKKTIQEVVNEILEHVKDKIGTFNETKKK
jgi:cytidylate kinase